MSDSGLIGIQYRGIKLLWACLLHDIGISEISVSQAEIGAVVAEALVRYGMEPEQIETISFLIREYFFAFKGKV
jgi:hypothetical protein